MELELIQGNDGIELVHGAGNWKLKREIGFSPVQTLAATVGACGAYVYQGILNNSNIPYTFNRATVTYETDLEKAPNPIKSVQLTFYADVTAEYQGRAERALKLVSKNCPVIQSLDPAITVTEKVIFA